MTTTKRRPLAYFIEHRIADLVAPRLRRGFLTILNEMRPSVPEWQRVLEMAHGSVDRAMDGFSWRHWELALLERYEGLIRTVVEEAGQAQQKHLRIQKAETTPIGRLGFRFDLTNPRALKWIEQHAAELVVDVSESTKLAIRAQIEQMFREGIPPDRMARRLREIVGLTQREAQAVENFRRKLELENAKRIAEQRKPLAQDSIDLPVQQYADRLLRQRAERIARTESIRASAEGQQELWSQAREQGYLEPARTKRAWLVTPDERLCPICAPLAADKFLVGLEEPFPLETGDLVMTPPAHPQCRCAVGLVFPDDSGEFHHPQA